LANTRSAKKRVRAQLRKHDRNRIVRSGAKTSVAHARKEIASKTPEAAGLVADALSLLDRGAVKGILHRRNAARRKGRLMRLMHRSGLAPAVKPTPAAPPVTQAKRSRTGVRAAAPQATATAATGKSTKKPRPG
jgi:small subunit ribosomal protein S20